LINMFNVRESSDELERTLTKFVEITQCNGHYDRSRSFKVTDFSTNRKLIYDFLLVIHTNLPSISQTCTVRELWSNFP